MWIYIQTFASKSWKNNHFNHPPLSAQQPWCIAFISPHVRWCDASPAGAHWSRIRRECGGRHWGDDATMCCEIFMLYLRMIVQRRCSLAWWHESDDMTQRFVWSENLCYSWLLTTLAHRWHTLRASLLTYIRLRRSLPLCGSFHKIVSFFSCSGDDVPL